ncbi:MAG: hypothetical protein JW870_21110 [Candidatus Delongbacteria bacterium]|nr:hypothetical protein [Candidatus Delongbacteria bacterium]
MKIILFKYESQKLIILLSLLISIIISDTILENTFNFTIILLMIILLKIFKYLLKHLWYLKYFIIISSGLILYSGSNLLAEFLRLLNFIQIATLSTKFIDFKKATYEIMNLVSYCPFKTIESFIKKVLFSILMTISFSVELVISGKKMLKKIRFRNIDKRNLKSKTNFFTHMILFLFIISFQKARQLEEYMIIRQMTPDQINFISNQNPSFSYLLITVIVSTIYLYFLTFLLQ